MILKNLIRRMLENELANLYGITLFLDNGKMTDTDNYIDYKIESAREILKEVIRELK